jgi:hypothetical protein
MRPRGTDEYEVLHVGAPLELRRDGTGLRHYLTGRPLIPGTPLELLLADGAWLSGIYEWRGSEVTWPGFRFPLGGSLEDSNPRPSMVAAIHPGAILRWPPG